MDKNPKKKKWLLLILIPVLILLCGGIAIATAVVMYFNSQESTSDYWLSDVNYGGTDELYKTTGAVEESEMAISPEYDSYTMDDSTYSTDSTVTWGERIIKSGYLTIVVDDLDIATDSLEAIVETEQGYITSLNDYEGSSGGRIISVVFKVPQERFDSALEAVKGIADEVMTESVDAQDVTQEYTDLQSRLTNLRAAEQQYLNIMTQATDVEDILAVQAQLDTVREEIELIQGQINYYDSYTEYSTITVYMSVSPENIEIPEEKWRPWAVVVEAWDAFLEVLKGLYAVIIWILIFSPCVWLPILIIAVIRKIVKNKKAKQAKK